MRGRPAHVSFTVVRNGGESPPLLHVDRTVLAFDRIGAQAGHFAFAQELAVLGQNEALIDPGVRGGDGDVLMRFLSLDVAEAGHVGADELELGRHVRTGKAGFTAGELSRHCVGHRVAGSHETVDDIELLIDVLLGQSRAEFAADHTVADNDDVLFFHRRVGVV